MTGCRILWEEAKGLDPKVNDAADDPDKDTLSNVLEYQKGTDPLTTDSDRDGIGDGSEISMDTDPLNPADVPELSLATSRLLVTDVTPVSFSLVWVSNQAGTPFANVYTDPAGNQLLKRLIIDEHIKDESSSHPPAGDNGVMKVNVSSFFSPTLPTTSVSSRLAAEGVLVEPAGGVLPGVRTEDRGHST